MKLLTRQKIERIVQIVMLSMHSFNRHIIVKAVVIDHSSCVLAQLINRLDLLHNSIRIVHIFMNNVRQYLVIALWIFLNLLWFLPSLAIIQ